MPRLSVFLPVQNGAETILHAVRSTLRAMPKDSELVVWDDASTDGTRAVLATLRDPRMRVLDSAVNIGPGAAMRELFARTDSQLVARMDADDVCLPARFRLQQAAMARGGVDILFSSVIRFRNPPFRVSPSAPATITPTAMPLHLAVMCVVMQPTMMARRSAIESIGGYHPVRSEDYELWLRACTADLRLRRMAMATVAYRRHPGQISFSAGPEEKEVGRTELAQPFRGFARHVLDLDTSWVPGTPAADDAQRDAVCAVEAAIRERAARLPGSQRVLVERTLRHLPTVE